MYKPEGWWCVTSENWIWTVVDLQRIASNPRVRPFRSQQMTRIRIHAHDLHYMLQNTQMWMS